MAGKRYSREDQRKMTQDQMAELRERGIADAREIRCLSPEGTNKVLKDMLKNVGHTRDQSQAQLAKGKETLKDRKRESLERAAARRKELGLD